MAQGINTIHHHRSLRERLRKMSGRRRHGPRRRVIAVLIAALAFQQAARGIVAAWPRFQPGSAAPAEDFPRFNPAGIDFAVVYVAARRVAAGQDPYLTYPDDLGKLELGQLTAPGALDHVVQRPVAAGPPGWRNLYGPATAFVFLPLAGMEFPAAFRWMAAVTLVSIAGSLLILSAGLGLGLPVAALTLALGATLIAGSYPLAFMLERGNWYSVLQLLIALAAVLMARGWPAASGGVLGLCAGLKVSPGGLALAWAAAPVRGRRALAGFALAGAASVLALGPAVLREWLAVLRAHGSVVGVGTVNHSFTVFTLLFDRPNWWPFFLAFSFAVIAWLVLVQRAAAAHGEPPVLKAAAFLAPLPLLSLLPPISNDYNLTLLALSYLTAVLVVAPVAANGRGARAAMAGLTIAALVAVAALLFGAPIPASGHAALLVSQKTLQVMALQVLVLIAVTLTVTGPLARLPRPSRAW